MKNPISEIKTDAELLQRVVSAVAKTEEYIHAGRCLERALTAWLLLHRRARCKVCLGAGFDTEGKVFAHAWLESDGVVVMGRSSEAISPLEMPNPDRL